MGRMWESQGIEGIEGIGGLDVAYIDQAIDPVPEGI